MLVSRFEGCSTLSVLTEKLDGVPEMEPGLVNLSGGSIETSEAERSDGEARLDCESLEVVRLGSGEVVQ